MITAQRAPWDKRSDAEIYEDILALAREAERLGFDSLWLSEHHFVDDGYMPSLLPVAAAISASTERIKICTGILIAPLYDPIRLAEDAATVDLISGGRLILGLGSGYRDEEFAGLETSFHRPGNRTEEIVSILRDAWSPRTARRSPTAAKVSVTPKPHQMGGPPIWLAARSTIGLMRASRVGDGFLAARVSPAAFAKQVRAVREGLQSQRRVSADFEIGVHCPVFAWPTSDAWNLVRKSLDYVEWKYRDMVERRQGQHGSPVRPPAMTAALEGRLAANSIVGSPAEVAEQIESYREAAAGPLHFVARLYWPGMDPDVQREAMAIFAGQVIPLLTPKESKEIC
jgi:alkanesulfonate monooxygenase SsuD/methylene tetrahydromethanopterin reductase-like flavin-dependent oxidoreductase (luciferase family)